MRPGIELKSNKLDTNYSEADEVQKREAKTS
jgi:hypothetical protein